MELALSSTGRLPLFCAPFPAGFSIAESTAWCCAGVFCFTIEYLFWALLLRISRCGFTLWITGVVLEFPPYIREFSGDLVVSALTTLLRQCINDVEGDHPLKPLSSRLLFYFTRPTRRSCHVSWLQWQISLRRCWRMQNLCQRRCHSLFLFLAGRSAVPGANCSRVRSSRSTFWSQLRTMGTATAPPISGRTATGFHAMTQVVSVGTIPALWDR